MHIVLSSEIIPADVTIVPADKYGIIVLVDCISYTVSRIGATNHRPISISAMKGGSYAIKRASRSGIPR